MSNPFKRYETPWTGWNWLYGSMVSKLYLNVPTEQSIFPIAGDSIGQENLQCLVTL
ncbi:hypothetical protein [uncultured Thiothrix sp.]|jgi:hypothetical protein|uniref:hypothetical protein n=1 Tax=uncultured Thiothrix sp. TaxID=223185 RepID=UPI0026328FBB|nr:hypothetical protein [uncultured Thiothrix sp.]